MAGLNRRNIEIFRGFEPDAQRRHRVKYAISGWTLGRWCPPFLVPVEAPAVGKGGSGRELGVLGPIEELCMGFVDLHEFVGLVPFVRMMSHGLPSVCRPKVLYSLLGKNLLLGQLE